MLTGLIVLATGACASDDLGVTDAQPPAKLCSPNSPAFIHGADRGRVTPVGRLEGNLQLGMAARDATVTVVGYCLPEEGFPNPAPKIEAGGRTISPVGGRLEEGSDSRFNYFFYPPTDDNRLRVLQGSRHLGTISFSEKPRESCSLRATGRFEVVACGAIVILDWSSPIDVRARALELLEADAFDKVRGDPLGFYFLRARNGLRGLKIRFGFMKPRSGRVLIRATRLYLKSPDQTGLVEEVLAPPVSESLILKPVT